LARALTAKEPGAPQARVLRQALFSWAFNPATRDADSPPEVTAALDWAERALAARRRIGGYGHRAAHAGRLRP